MDGMAVKRWGRWKALLLAAALLTVWLGGAACYTGSRREEPYPLRETMLDAYDRMAACMQAVQAEKLRRGLSIDPVVDPFDTGMLGIASSAITTTLGALEAKRTSANPDMAALCVRLFHEAGVKAGSRVGCCFSGSFPSLNIAVLCALDAIGAQPVYIASVGASTYGANQPELTGPEMLQLCYQQGLLSTPPAAVTLGGGQDLGQGMMAEFFDEEALLEETLQRLEQEGLHITRMEDYAENVAWRMSVYGPIDCFVNAGGNVTATGRDEAGYHLGQGLLRSRRFSSALTDQSGLLCRYLAAGVPAIQLLNLKKLCADYHLDFDPSVWPARGESGVFYQTGYSRVGLAVTAGAALLCLLAYYGVRQWEKRSACKSKTENSSMSPLG